MKKRGSGLKIKGTPKMTNSAVKGTHPSMESKK
jgi:hypothetical protein